MKKILLAILFTTLLVFPTIGLVHAATEEPTFYTITQSNTTYLIETIKGSEGVTAETFYNYYSASGHTPYMDDTESKIYLYEDSTGVISLIIHHGADNNGIRAYVNFDFEDLPEGAEVMLSDDPTHTWNETRQNGKEFDITQQPEGNWYFTDNSDGGILELPSGLWTFKITPNFISETITDWKIQETESTIALDMTEPIIVSNDLSNLSPDSAVGLNFEDLSGGGSIGVIRKIVDPSFPSPFFDITVTIEFGTARICVNYDDEGMSKGQEKNLQLLATERIIQGDVNFDGIVDHKDIQSIKQAIKLWNQSPDDSNINNNGHGNGWNPYCDIDEDGDVDQDDLELALLNLGESSPWFDITQSINLEENIICGETTHFSIFRCR